MLTNKMLASKILTYTFFVFLMCIGSDKIFQSNFITDWQGLVGPVVSFLLPIGAGSVVMLEGAVEIILGISLLTRWKTTGLVILVITIAIITIDLFILGDSNLAIREIILMLICYVMYLLDERTPELMT